MKSKHRRKLAYALGAILVAVTAVNVAVAVFADGWLSIAEFQASPPGEPYRKTNYVLGLESGVPFPSIAASTHGASFLTPPPPAFNISVATPGDNLTVTFVKSSFNKSNTVGLVVVDLIKPENRGMHLRGREPGVSEIAVNASDAGVLDLPIQAGDSFTIVNATHPSAGTELSVWWKSPHPSLDSASLDIIRLTRNGSEWSVETCPGSRYDC